MIVCPICAKSVRITSTDDAAVAEAFALHSATDCDPANYQRVHNKKKCPATGCKAKLTDSNTYTCKICGKAVCMAHRFEKDHQCTGVSISLQTEHTLYTAVHAHRIHPLPAPSLVHACYIYAKMELTSAGHAGPQRSAGGYHSVLGKYAQKAQTMYNSSLQQAQTMYNSNFPAQKVDPVCSTFDCLLDNFRVCQ